MHSDVSRPGSSSSMANRATDDMPLQAVRGGAGDVSHVLRNAFQATVDESVPSEMLDLLAKLS